jgi:PAS domain S-box-containing protein
MDNTVNPVYIIIIEDEKGLRIGTQRILQREGYIVDTAEGGVDGIKLALENDYDIAVIDLKMPDIDGIEVLKKIKTSKPNTICYIATAYASYETAIESTKLGADGYMLKPFTSEELIQNIHKGYEKRLLLLETERLKKERTERLLEIAFEKTRLNTIINSIADGIIVVNKTGELVLFNPASLKYFDFNKAIIGEYILGVLPQQISDLVNKFIKPDSPVESSFTTQIELKPNRELFIEVTCSPVPHPNGSLAGVVIVMSNVTEAKKVEYVKSQFVSMVAHELKTPLAAVMGFLNIMLDPKISITPEQSTDYLGRSFNRLKSLVEMVNDLLDISRMEMKTKEREIKEVKVDEVLTNILEFLEFEIKKRELSVIFNKEENIPFIKADQNEINRLFTNIISNAIKYNSSDGNVAINISYKDNCVITSVSDNGIGMKPEEREKLFQEFYRVKNQKTRGVSGTGLGLSIVKRIVESYSGKIEVDSEFGKGTKFTVFLPSISK